MAVLGTPHCGRATCEVVHEENLAQSGLRDGRWRSDPAAAPVPARLSYHCAMFGSIFGISCQKNKGRVSAPNLLDP